ncbi:putative ribonuclease H-like domain-containing protein [Tanacetum coccineum]|uniref:Ribonuclease H-like domain-containing protein n=1 Tax=Tanacetum coccineum TaxID=301880 RepID=A0ABQ5FYM7_9ASTR
MDYWKKIDIRWQVAMITARIRKFMRKTGRPIDLKPKNGITFDKSKIECFNCQKLGHFARECRFAKYQENRANGRQEKRIVAIEDSNSKALLIGVESSSSMDSENTSRNTNSSESSYPNFQKAKGFHSVPPPTGTIIPPRANVSFTGIDELAIRNKVLNQENTKTSQPEIDRNKVIIEDWVDSDDEETVLNTSEIQKKTVSNSENSETSFENSPNHLIKDCNLHERTFKQTQTHKPKGTQGSRDTRPVWNNIQRVNHSNFSRNSRYPHQRRSFIPSAVLTREGLKNQSTTRSTVTSTGRPYYPRMDNTRPRTSSFSRTPHRPQRPKKIVKSIWVKKGSTVGTQAVLPQTVKESAMMKSNQTWRPKGAYLDSVNRDNGSYTLKQFEYGNPEEDLKDYAIIDSGCSGSMTGDKDKLSDFKEFKGGYVAFGNDSKGGRISGKGTIKTSCLDFEKVSYVEELKFNLLSVSQICDKKHNVLFTDKECLILSPKFKFVDEDLVILRAPRKNDVYSLDLKNIIPSGGITCLVAKATKMSCLKWHRRLGHVNFKNINKLVKGNLVRGLPSKTFKLEHSCLACRKGKQHRASCKKIEERTVREPLELLHMDLFGPVSVESVNRKKYCLVVTDDCSKFSWVFFLAYKDETYDMLHDLIVGLENTQGHKVRPSGGRNRSRINNDVFVPRKESRENIALQGLHSKMESQKERIGLSLKLLELLPRSLGVTKRSRLSSCKLLRSENQKGKGPDWMFDLDLLTPSMNYIPVRKENYADSGGQETACNDVEDEQHFIVHGPNIHAAQHKPSEERTANKEVPLSSEEQALHDELVNLMHQESLAKLHNDTQRTAFEKEKKRIALEKGKECVDSTFTLSTANTPPQSTGNTPTDSDDDIPKDGVFSTNSFDDENTDTEEELTQDQQTCLFACFLSQEENPRKSSQALAMKVGEAMQEELLRFKLQELGVMTMIGCVMYSNASRPDIMFAVVYVQEFHVHSKGHPFHYEALSDSDYAGTIHEIDEQLHSASCCAQVLWMQNQLLDYGFNFLNTEIHIDNESTICIVRNPVLHSKTKHIQIRHHFIRDCYEQRLINVVKVHTDDNVADLLTKGFDLARFNFLVVTIGMMNP